MPGGLTQHWRPALAAGFVVLAGCATAPPASAPGGGGRVAKVADPVFTSDRILAGGTGREIDFGRAEPGAVAAMSKLMGRAPTEVALACSGLRAARWPDGTALYFEIRPYDQPGLVGWRHDGATAGRTC